MLSNSLHPLVDSLLETLERTVRERLAERASAASPTFVVAILYESHAAAEAGICRLSAAGLPLTSVSIVGRMEAGVWTGGIFSLMRRGNRFRLLPDLGGLVVLGVFSGHTHRADGDPGDGALTCGLRTMGISRRQALHYRSRLLAGDLLVLVQGSDTDARQARGILTEPERQTMHHLEHPGAPANERPLPDAPE